jgi:hypothetical protein
MLNDLPYKFAALLANERGRFDRTLGEDLRNLKASYGSGSHTVLLMHQQYEADIEERLSALLGTLKRLLASPPEREIRDNKLELDRLAQVWLQTHIEECQSHLNEHVARIGPESLGRYDLGRDRFLSALAVELDLLSVTYLSVVNRSVVPPEIKESLEWFRRDHPDSDRVAFLMMRFGKTKAHENIVAGIKATLDSQNVAALRADAKQYHDDLFPNVLTYVYGCRFGIAVFERIETEQFNPNVALEVGYMLALRKHVCLLKDRTLTALHTDLVGKLYKEFDPLDPIATIPNELSRWLKDKGLGRSAQPGAQADG